ncbi:hypothetical protein, partial [Stenotrophomonas maltophilia]|uniref:hypothetical protein n=1 Tax=Stenotrophomonas maltophilia TaxID=40324 RepID=UPI0019531077
LGGSWLGSLACGNGLRNRGEKRSERRPGKAGNGEDTEFTIIKKRAVRTIFQRGLARRSSFTAPV